jgi:hypothetical protein
MQETKTTSHKVRKSLSYSPQHWYKPYTYLVIIELPSIRCHDQGWIMEILIQLLETNVEDYGLIMEILTRLLYYQLFADNENGRWECKGEILRG